MNSTVMDRCHKLGLGPAAVEGILERGVSTTGDWSSFTTLETLGLEEMALPRGPGNYGAVISTRDAHGPGSILAVLPTRRKATVKAVLEAMPAALKATIQTLDTARSDGYINAVAEALPGLTGVVDRFPGAHGYHDRVEPLRQQELKRLAPQLPDAEDEPLKGLP